MTWSLPIRIAEVPTDGLSRTLAAGDAERAALVKELHLLDLASLEAQVVVKPWFDGVEVTAMWSARFGQACGVSLERIDQALEGDFRVHVVPLGSVHAPSADDLGDLDPDAIDPPDVSPDGALDLAGYVVEHMALEIDPFPRKPGAEFTPPDPGPDLSPFAVLRKLKQED